MEALTGTRPLEEMRRRGRWVSLKSVQRYTKTHTMVSRLAKLPPEIREQGERFTIAAVEALTRAVNASPAGSCKRPLCRALEAALCANDAGPYRSDLEFPDEKAGTGLRSGDGVSLRDCRACILQKPISPGNDLVHLSRLMLCSKAAYFVATARRQFPHNG